MNNNQNNTFPSYSLGFSNFLSSFGGGVVLGKAMGLLQDVPYLKGDSLLAYLLGTTFGLIVMKTLGKNNLLKNFTKYSFISSAVSFFAILVLQKFYDKIVGGSLLSFLFFFLLILRFGFWFLARIVRVEIAAGINKNLAWTELSYYLGAIFGLLVWPLWKSVTISELLFVDISALLISGFFDLYSFKKLKNFFKIQSEDIKSNKIPYNIFLRFAGFVVCITIATQIVEFGFATFSVSFFDNGKSFASNIVAAGYVGAAIGAFFLGKMNFEYSENDGFLNLGKVKSSFLTTSVLNLSLACFFSLCAAFGIAFFDNTFSKPVSLILFCISALIYDLLVLVIIDGLGAIAKKAGDAGSVADVYAYMGAIGTLCMIIFVQILNNKFDFIFCSLLFFIFGILFLKIRTYE